MARMLMVLTATMLFGATFLLPAQAAEEMDFERNDYSDVATWLCHPDKTDDACAVDLTATIIARDGTTSIESVEAAEDPGIDCFYI